MEEGNRGPVEFSKKPESDELYMITGFRQWADAGSVSSGLPEYLVQQTQAESIGRMRPDGFNYVQGGLLIYGDDNNFIKLTSVSIWETRQTEFAKELYPVPEGYPRYGNTVGTAPNTAPDGWTYLRIARQVRQGEELYTAYTSRDGVHWNHDGTWTHTLGASAKIGLVSMGGSGFQTTFDYVRVYKLKQRVSK